MHMEMITKSNLKSERGWTDSLIREFLPNPDMIKQNPHYRSGSPMLLYKISNINEIENSVIFKSRLKIVKKRKVSAKKSIKTKIRKLKEYLDTIKINLPILEKEKLINRACSHYNRMQENREMQGLKTCGLMASNGSDTVFIDRITVNYIRHSLSKYEDYLDKTCGKVGFSEAYLEIRNKIFLKISELYPWLLKECQNQGYVETSIIEK